MSPEKSEFWGAEPVTQPGGPEPGRLDLLTSWRGATWGLQGHWETLWGHRSTKFDTSSPFHSPMTPMTVWVAIYGKPDPNGPNAHVKMLRWLQHPGSA